MSCRAFFEELPTDRELLKERCERVDKAFPGGSCQLESVSSHSSGIVQEGEYAHRFVFSPIHMEGENIKAAFFSDCQYGGLSCQRADTESAGQDIHGRGVAQVEEWNAGNTDPVKVRLYLGVVSAQVSDIRAMKARSEVEHLAARYDQPMMAVYDTAKKCDEKHIDVFQLLEGRKRSELKQARRDLALVFTRRPAQLSR